MSSSFYTTTQNPLKSPGATSPPHGGGLLARCVVRALSAGKVQTVWVSASRPASRGGRRGHGLRGGLSLGLALSREVSQDASVRRPSFWAAAYGPCVRGQWALHATRHLDSQRVVVTLSWRRLNGSATAAGVAFPRLRSAEHGRRVRR